MVVVGGEKKGEVDESAFVRLYTGAICIER